MTRTAEVCYWPRATIHVETAGHAGVLAQVRAAMAACEADTRAVADNALDIDITHCQTRAGTPELIGRQLFEAVHRRHPDAPLILGIAHDPWVARLAARLSRDGRSAITVIPPWEARARVTELPLALIDFLNPRLMTFLAAAGLRSCGDVARLPAAMLERRFGIAGRRLWLLCRGQDGSSAVDESMVPRRLVQTAVLPPRTDRPRTIEAYLRQGCRLLTRRLRRLGLEAACLSVTLRYSRDSGSAARTVVRRIDVETAGVEVAAYFEPLRAVLHPELGWQAVSHASLAAERLRGRGGQLELFGSESIA